MVKTTDRSHPLQAAVLVLIYVTLVAAVYYLLYWR